MNSKMIRVGIIGAGPMGRLHARTVVRSAEHEKNCTLAVVVDRHDGRAECVAKEFGPARRAISKQCSKNWMQ